MGTTLNTFADIFNTSYELEGEKVQLQKIVIPIIQRDYAQGRLDPEVTRIRNRFLDSLHQAIIFDPITLDFIYGDIDENGVMTPLDGQQRLTALFLLHWYASKKESIASAEYEFLNNFSYETRYSARDFCSFLINFNPSFSRPLSEDIIDQAWFPLDWKRDPTISSMLVVLDAIQTRFADTENIWTKLKDGTISFYFLPIKDVGLTDELYIKMNSRGKPLTQFEHFKAELERELIKVDKTKAKDVIKNIDINWTDMLWQYRGDDNIIDDEFMRYFNFICDIICYQNGGTTQGRSSDEFYLLEEYFSVNNENILANVQILEDYFNCWCSLQEDTPDEFFGKYISHVHQTGKIKIDNRYKINVFKDCLNNYGKRQFSLGRLVLLFAVISYLLNKNTITEDEFARRLRIVNNLIQNSEDEISDSELRAGGNRMPAILKQVDFIIKNGEINHTLEANFNQTQLNEEAFKILWVKENPSLADRLFELEDHDMLHGQVGIVGLDLPEHFARFSSLFLCNWDLVDCALMSLGNYSQREFNGWRYQVGSRSKIISWRNLFHRSRNEGFDQTKEILRRLLSRTDNFSNEHLISIINEYIHHCMNTNQFEWQYYYIKYDHFRPGEFGKIYWHDFEDKPYELLIMATQSQVSQNSYQPFLKEINDKYLSKDHHGKRIIYNNRYIICTNSAYIVKDIETEKIINKINIAQNKLGVDIEDRIKILLKYWNTVLNVKSSKNSNLSGHNEEAEEDKLSGLDIQTSFETSLPRHDLLDQVAFEVTDSNVSSQTNLLKKDDETLFMDYRSLKATGRRTGKYFMIHKGSQISEVIKPSCPEHAVINRQRYSEKINSDYILTDDILLTTPSAAACFVSGASLNGKIVWKSKDGRTLKEIESE